MRVWCGTTWLACTSTIILNHSTSSKCTGLVPSYYAGFRELIRCDHPNCNSSAKLLIRWHLHSSLALVFLHWMLLTSLCWLRTKRHHTCSTVWTVLCRQFSAVNKNPFPRREAKNRVMIGDVAEDQPRPWWLCQKGTFSLESGVFYDAGLGEHRKTEPRPLHWDVVVWFTLFPEGSSVCWGKT